MTINETEETIVVTRRVGLKDEYAVTYYKALGYDANSIRQILETPEDQPGGDTGSSSMLSWEVDGDTYSDYHALDMGIVAGCAMRNRGKKKPYILHMACKVSGYPTYVFRTEGGQNLSIKCWFDGPHDIEYKCDRPDVKNVRKS